MCILCLHLHRTNGCISSHGRHPKSNLCSIGWITLNNHQNANITSHHGTCNWARAERPMLPNTLSICYKVEDIQLKNKMKQFSDVNHQYLYWVHFRSYLIPYISSNGWSWAFKTCQHYLTQGYTTWQGKKWHDFFMNFHFNHNEIIIW